MRIIARTFAALVASASAATLFGAGTANATDPLVGKTFAEATSTMTEKWNATPVVASVVGGLLDRDDCVVMSWHKSIFLDASGDKSGASNIYVNLNCNAAVAAPGTPGNSLASPPGKLERKNNETAEYINSHPEYCENNPGNCDWFCDKYADKCTAWPS
jgi:hypothetical protein